jgi:hypothetical protein
MVPASPSESTIERVAGEGVKGLVPELPSGLYSVRQMLKEFKKAAP